MRYDNPFAAVSQAGRYRTDPGFSALGSMIGTALFGNPQAAAEQEFQRARTDQARAGARYDTERGNRAAIENEAVRGLPALFARFLTPRQPEAAQPPEDAIIAPTGMDGVARAIAEALPDETGMPAPQVWDERMPQIGPRDPLDRDTRIDDFRAGVPAILAAMAQGDIRGADSYIRTLAAMFGDDETARRGLIAGGATPGAAFALTPNRADDIRGQGFDAQMDRAELGAETTRRGQDLTDARGRRGQDLTDARGRRGQDMTDSRNRRGQDMTDARGRRGQDMQDRRARDGVGGRGRGGRGAGRQQSPGGTNAPPPREGQTATNRNTGQRVVYRGGRWVPLT